MFPNVRVYPDGVQSCAKRWVHVGSQAVPDGPCFIRLNIEIRNELLEYRLVLVGHDLRLCEPAAQPRFSDTSPLNNCVALCKKSELEGWFEGGEDLPCCWDDGSRLHKHRP